MHAGWPRPEYRLLFLWRCDPTRVMASSFLRFSKSHTTTHHNRKDSSEWVISSSQRPVPDSTQHLQKTSIPPVGFEPTILAGERPQTYALDRAATGTGRIQIYTHNIKYLLLFDGNSGYSNVSKCYIIRTLPVLLILNWEWNSQGLF